MSAARLLFIRHNTAAARPPTLKLPGTLARAPTVFVLRGEHVPPLYLPYDGIYAVLWQSLHQFTLQVGDKTDKVYTRVQ